MMKFRKEKGLDNVWIGRGYDIVVLVKLDEDGAYRTWSTLSVGPREQAFDTFEEVRKFYNYCGRFDSVGLGLLIEH